jgi:diacylglycerol kinase (ATP)
MSDDTATQGRATPSGKGGVTQSFRAAFAGVCRTISTQRNMKLHVLAAVMVMIVGMALPLDLSTRVALLFAVAMVFFAEILNTGLEALTDLYTGDFHRLAMVAKDGAAAGVLVLALVTAIVLGEILYTRWDIVADNTDAVQRSVMFGVPLVVVEAVGLFWVRRGAVAVLRVLVAGGLAVPLVLASTDDIFSGILVVLVGVSAYARHAFPSWPGRGAPPTDGEVHDDDDGRDDGSEP